MHNQFYSEKVKYSLTHTKKILEMLPPLPDQKRGGITIQVEEGEKE